KVRFSGSDDRGLRGQEVRVHRPNGSVTAWTPSQGVAPDLTVSDVGTSYVEVRSLDVNGNLSASHIVSVTVSAGSSPFLGSAPTVTSGPTGLTLNWSAPSDDGGSAVTGYTVRTYVGAPAGAVASTATTTARTLAVPAPPAGAIVTFTVAPKN